MGAKEVVTIKFPLYLGETKERRIKGTTTAVESFVELWQAFDISQQQLLARPQVHLGLRVPAFQEHYIGGGGNANVPDPIRLYRALQLLNRFEDIPNPYEELGDTYEAAGPVWPLEFYRPVRNRVSGIVGKEEFDAAVQMTPPNLQQVVENLRRHHMPIFHRTLQREIRRGRIEPTPLYERVIQQGERRDKREERLFQRWLLVT